MNSLKKKSITTICIIVLMLILSENIVEAKSSKVKKLEVGKTYYYDLNGDKKNEKIVCKIVHLYDSYVQWKIYIDDKLACSKSHVYKTADFYLTDFNIKDKYRELGVHEGIEEQGYDYTVFYRYKGGELKNYFNFSESKILSRYSLDKKQPGNGKIRFLSDTPFYEENLGCYFVRVDYMVSKGKFKKVTGNTYTVIGDWGGNELSYQLSKSVKVRYGIKDSRTKYTLKKGTRFCLKKIYVSKNKIKYIYIKTSSGKKGWIRLPKSKFVNEVYGWG